MNLRFIIKCISVFSFFVVLFIVFFHPTHELSLDTGEHLLIGKNILLSHKFVTTNLFSYTNSHFLYVTNEWLVDMIYYIIFRNFSTYGLILLTISICLAAFAIIYFYALRRFNFFAVCYASFFYLGFLSDRTYVRPEIFSYLLLSIFTVILYNFREKQSKLIYVLIPLSLIWINMHIYSSVGIFLEGLFLLEGLFSFGKPGFTKDYIITLAKVFILSIVVSLINPYGIQGFLFPLTLSNYYPYPIQENLDMFTRQSLNAHNYIFSYITFEIVAVLFLIILGINYKKARIVDWFLAIIFIIASIDVVRNIPLFIFVTFIPFVSNLTIVINSISKKFVDKFKKIAFYFLPLPYFLLLIWYVTFITPVQGFGFGTDKRGEKALNFFISNNIEGPIFNDYDTGSYIAFRLYPKERVFVDSRPEAYPYSFFQNSYFPMQEQKDVFYKEDNIYHFNVVIFSITDQVPQANTFLKGISNDNNWKIVYLDNYFVILARDNKKNEILIKKYQVNNDTYSVPNLKSNLDLDTIAYFLGNIGWTNASIKTYEKAVALYPNDCVALNNIIYLSNYNTDIEKMYMPLHLEYCQINP